MSLPITFRFIQVSDVHLGRRFAWLPKEKREERRLDLRKVWQRVVDEAIERRVDGILVPGDLFDGEEADAETVNRVIECVDRPGCPPVFIAPGNHDCYSVANIYYDNEKLAARGQKTWPEHVHIYKSPDFSLAPVTLQPEVQVWGRCVHANVESDERILLDLPHLASNRLNIALLHGSRDGFLKPGKRLTAPFSDEEVLRSGYDYIALGHYHEPAEILDDRGMRRAAYSGSAAALDRDETGLHGALDVKVSVDINAAPESRLLDVSSERVELDPRRLIAIDVDLTGCGSNESAEERVLNALDDAEARNSDLVVCRLLGRPRPGVELRADGEKFGDRVWYMHTDGRALRPDYDLDSYRTIDPRTTEERFARSLLVEIEAETDAEKKSVLEAALYYGLDALKQGEVSPRYEWGAK